jgi:anti-sigma factor RsiW
MTHPILTLLSCKHALAQLDLYLDHVLSPREMKSVRTHLAICHACEEKFAFEERFVEVVRKHLQSIATLEELAQRVDLDRLRRAFETAGSLSAVAHGDK